MSPHACAPSKNGKFCYKYDEIEKKFIPWSVNAGESIFLSEFGNENYYTNALLVLARPNCVVIFIANRFPRMRVVSAVRLGVERRCAVLIHDSDSCF